MRKVTIGIPAIQGIARFRAWSPDDSDTVGDTGEVLVAEPEDVLEREMSLQLMRLRVANVCLAPPE